MNEGNGDNVATQATARGFALLAFSLPFLHPLGSLVVVMFGRVLASNFQLD